MNTRRIFIKKSFGAVAALGLSENLFPSVFLPAKKEKLGVALVGLGYYSTDLLAPAAADTVIISP